MTVMVDDFRDLYNAVRPHEHLAGDRPLERYLAEPVITPSATAPGHTPNAPKRADSLTRDNGTDLAVEIVAE